ESGVLRLIGATTHNPFFYINSPLVSRSQVFQLEPLTPEHLIAVMKRALTDQERGLGKYHVEITDEALRHLAITSDGDARKCLNALEIGVLTTPPTAVAGVSDPGHNIAVPDHNIIRFGLRVAEESIQRKAVV